MWAEACEFLDRAERIQRQFFRPGGSQTRTPVWEPPVDVFETERELVIEVALPGVEPGQVALLIDGRTLIIAGERKLPQEARGAAIRRLELPHGRFERRIELPPGRFEIAGRDLTNGCLLLTLRKLR
jgi:HSP20 family molecular chaperone IbpA